LRASLTLSVLKEQLERNDTVSALHEITDASVFEEVFDRDDLSHFQSEITSG